MPRRRLAACFWAAVFGVLGIVDLKLAEGPPNGDTLSEVTRVYVPTPIFVGIWAGLTYWLLSHLYRKDIRS